MAGVGVEGGGDGKQATHSKPVRLLGTAASTPVYGTAAKNESHSHSHSKYLVPKSVVAVLKQPRVRKYYLELLWNKACSSKRVPFLLLRTFPPPLPLPALSLPVPNTRLSPLCVLPLRESPVLSGWCCWEKAGVIAPAVALVQRPARAPTDVAPAAAPPARRLAGPYGASPRTVDRWMRIIGRCIGVCVMGKKKLGNLVSFLQGLLYHQ